jgi:DNA modification methylase
MFHSGKAGVAVSVRIIIGDCREKLRELPDASVNCCVTSPPYFGLRDYGVDGQMGLEPTPDEFVAGMVEVFREVRRVLRDDGTLWLNIGDSYASQGGKNTTPHTGAIFADRARGQEVICRQKRMDRSAGRWGGGNNAAAGEIKAKDMIGIPWLLAFALRADGWYLRQDIIWSKPNPMPESVRDRCTKAHEYLFLLSKGPRYYFDADGIRENAASSWDPDNCKAPDGWDTGAGGHGAFHRQGRQAGSSGNKARKPASARGVPVDTDGKPAGAVAGSVPWQGTTRNKRSVWEVSTQPFSEAHFATFPPALIEPCVLAGCPAGGTVLDPFFGAGTTGLVADRLQRDCIGIELNPEYAEIAQKRLGKDGGMFSEVLAA